MADDYRTRMVKQMVGEPGVRLPKGLEQGVLDSDSSIMDRIVRFLVGGHNDPVGPVQYGVPVGGVGSAAGMLGSGARAGTAVVPYTGGLVSRGGLVPRGSTTAMRGPVTVGSRTLPAGQRATVTGTVRNPGTRGVRVPGMGRSSGAGRPARPAQGALPAPWTPWQGGSGAAAAGSNVAGNLTKGAIIAAGGMGAYGAVRAATRGSQGSGGGGTGGNPGGTSDGPAFPGGPGGTQQPMDGWHGRMGLGGGSPSSPQAVTDPYDEFLQDYIAQITGAYDNQISAIGGLGPLFQSQAAEAQGNIGNFFGYAEGVAQEGMPVTEEIYDTAQANVGDIYDGLASSLGAMPQQMVDRASAAAGSAIGGSVADNVAAATAPFAAAGETSRANATANLVQGSSAGQSYLNNLASAAPAEGALHQSAVEQAMNQQLQLVAYKQAELEGAKQRALMEISADVAGSTSERMANAALAQALGLDISDNIDPLDFLKGQDMMQGDPLDQVKAQRDLVGLQQAELNLMQDIDPNFRTEQILGTMPAPIRSSFENVQRMAEAQAPTGGSGVPEPRAVALKMLELIDEQYGEGNLEFFGIPGSARNSAVAADALDQSREQLVQAVRTLMM